MSYSKEYLVGRDLPQRNYEQEELYDLTWDPQQRHNIAGESTQAAELARMRQRLQDWMQETNDPLFIRHRRLATQPHASDPDCFTGNRGGAPLLPLPQHLRH